MLDREIMYGTFRGSIWTLWHGIEIKLNLDGANFLTYMGRFPQDGENEQNLSEFFLF